MRHNRSYQESGFTLIEVIIVVVLLGIMASLAIARLVGQHENGYVAEAVQTMSMLRRAELSYFNENSSYRTFDDTGGVDEAAWQILGLAPPYTDAQAADPVAGELYWVYEASATLITANRTGYRLGPGVTVGDWIGLSIESGDWSGNPNGPYDPTSDPPGNYAVAS